MGFGIDQATNIANGAKLLTLHHLSCVISHVNMYPCLVCVLSYRLHKDVHQAELRLEVALHNKQMALEEAASAAAGQTQQVCAKANFGAIYARTSLVAMHASHG
jgi:hypothetical protein